MEAAIQDTVLNVAKTVEKQIDEEIYKLENLDLDSIEKLREDHLKKLKAKAKQHQEWKALGHGEYDEIPEEKKFFDLCKKSPNMVVHFYKDGSINCKILDEHLKTLCKKHIETRFIKLNVERAPFLTERLRIKVIPTLALVKDSVTKDYIVGFTELGNCADFSTEMLEWRIAQGGVIDYAGDMFNPPDNKKKQKKRLIEKKKIIRGRNSSDEDSDDPDDW
ncbi:hypothetical protein WDU94_004523 [Cyamophila willieti]